MFDTLQNPLALVGRLLLAMLFLPAGISKLTGFAGTVGYISSVGMPLPQVAAALALVVEIGLSGEGVAGERQQHFAQVAGVEIDVVLRETDHLVE